MRWLGLLPARPAAIALCQHHQICQYSNCQILSRRTPATLAETTLALMMLKCQGKQMQRFLDITETQ